MIEVYNSITPKLTEPSGDLFSWTFSDDGSDFNTLAGLSNRITIFAPSFEGDKAYNHHPYGERHPAGYLVAFHSVHSHDEEGPGMWSRWHYSDNNGLNWTEAGDIFPPQSNVLRYTGNAGRIVIPIDFVRINGELFAVADVADVDYSSGYSRQGVGILARKINNDKSLEDIVWIHNSDGSQNPVSPVDGFPAYSYDVATRNKVYSYLQQINKRPKTNSSDTNLSITQPANDSVFGPLREPVTIRPAGYLKTWRYWKNNGENTGTYPGTGNGYKVFSLGLYGTDYAESSIPDSTGDEAIVTRFLQLNNDKILISGNARTNDRERLYLAITERNVSTGVYETTQVYLIDEDLTPSGFSGQFKHGGPQIVDFFIDGGYIYFIYTIYKESVHMKKVLLSSI